MRTFPGFALAVLASGIFAAPAFASTQSYCEIFAKDFADGRTTDVDLWQKSYRNAFNDCMNQYTAAAPQAPPKKPLQKDVEAPVKQPEVVAETSKRTLLKPPDPTAEASKPVLEPGSAAWNEYCAAKYKSFNPDTGTYNSLTGKERRCVVTQ
jgi:hypothetical protein